MNTIIFEGSLEWTSDNMDSWKSRGGKSQRGEQKKREDQRGERVRKKKMQVREKVGKSRFSVLFQWFVALEGGKGGLLKRWVWSQLTRSDLKNCTLLWREANFQVKMYKKLQLRSTFRSWDVEKKYEKVHTVVERSTFPSQNVQNTSSASARLTRSAPPLPCSSQGGLEICTTLRAHSNLRLRHSWTHACVFADLPVP